jgi:hypothetical protein
MIGRVVEWLWDVNDYPMLALVTWLLLAGCTSLAPQEPALPFPETPPVQFFQDQAGDICLSPPDANLLRKWKAKLDEFQAARARLLSTP